MPIRKASNWRNRTWIIGPTSTPTRTAASMSARWSTISKSRPSAINGPGFHTEMCLMCDITICTEDTIIYDLHYDIGSVPGDGVHSCFQELLGVKRAAYALLTGQAIDAKTALEYGMINEIVPREKVIERAYTLADHIMTQPRTTRRLTTQIVRRPWRQRITNDLDGGFGIQMFAHLAKKAAVHGRQHIGDTVAYVRKGKKNNFDT